MDSPEPKPVLASSGVLRPLIGLALPVLIDEALNLLVGYTNWWLNGRVSAATIRSPR